VSFDWKTYRVGCESGLQSNDVIWIHLYHALPGLHLKGSIIQDVLLHAKHWLWPVLILEADSKIKIFVFINNPRHELLCRHDFYHNTVKYPQNVFKVTEEI